MSQLKIIPDGLRLFPIQSPPEGVIPTFEPDHRQTAWIRGVSITAMAVVAICCSLRLYTNFRIIKRLTWTDYVFVLAWAMYVAFWGVAWYAITPGIYHQYNVYLKDAMFYLVWWPRVAIIYEFTIAIIKTVIAMELIRLFVPRKRGPLYWGYITIIIVSCISGVLCGFLEAFHCTPYDKQIYPLLLVNPQYGSCFDLDAARIAFSGCLVIQDIVLFVLPQYSIWSLKMSTRKKLGVSILFSLGLAACIFSSVRLFYTVRVKTRIDRLWWLALLGTFLMLELSCGLLIAAAPVLPRFFKHIRDTTKFGSKCKMIFGSAKSLVSSRGRKKREFSPDVTPLQNLESTQVSAQTDVTAVSAGEQARNTHSIAKTVEWNVKTEPNKEEAALLKEEKRLPTPPKATRNSGGHRPDRSRDWNDAETDREIQALLEEEDEHVRPAWSAFPRRSDHSVPRSAQWNVDVESGTGAPGYDRVQQRDGSQTRQPAWPGSQQRPPGWI